MKSESLRVMISRLAASWDIDQFIDPRDLSFSEYRSGCMSSK